ncbi:uncharacterized protein LOC134750823 [Cydia strobilella]|uniref:uncharacterized protein LOC134750823 n=1 Tax=Cydia strobilella TaxID=1100964 RepID=UPI0030078F27
MKLFVFILVVLTVAVCGLASPLPARFEIDTELYRPPRTPQFIKGQKGTRVPDPLNLRKGEYICGNKICSLKPGEIPHNCGGGLCQYKILK